MCYVGRVGGGGRLGLVLYIGPGWGYGGGPRRGVGRCGLPFTGGRGGSSWLERVPCALSPTPGRAPTVTPRRLKFGRMALIRAVRVGKRALWVRWRDFFQTLPMVPGSYLGFLGGSCAAGGHGKSKVGAVGV
eukprot:scaffold4760_cov113-Isochrysis_galbana.AAC.5